MLASDAVRSSTRADHGGGPAGAPQGREDEAGPRALSQSTWADNDAILAMPGYCPTATVSPLRGRARGRVVGPPGDVSRGPLKLPPRYLVGA